MTLDGRVNPSACLRTNHFGSLATLKKGVLAILLVGASGLAAAATPQSNANPCNVTAAEAVAMNSDFASDVNAIPNYMGAVAGILKAEKFEQLDCLADHARSTKERFPGGQWKLHSIYVGMYSPIQYPVTTATRDEWNAHLQRLQRWVEARPQSATARVALARAYEAYGDVARGEGYADTVSESGWKLFAERTAEAKRILEEASNLPTKCPEWYLAMLEVAQNQSRSASDARALFEESFKSEPEYFYNARILANYLQPKWTGEAGATEKFMQEIADRIGGEQGDFYYFQVAAAPGLVCGCPDSPRVNVARVGRGLEAAEKKYGVSMLNLNRAAYVVSLSRPGDPMLADKILTRIGEHWDEATWEKKEYFDNAKFFNSMMAKRLIIEAAADANMQTEVGMRYKASFEKPYKELVQQCVHPGNSDVGKFRAYTNVAENGAIEDVRIASNSAAAHCIYDKLHTLQQEKTAFFPPPPHGSYWVRLDLDWSEFTPVADAK